MEVFAVLVLGFAIMTITISFIGVLGSWKRSRSTQALQIKAYEELIAAKDNQLAAYENLIEALRRKATALENLVSEQEKAIGIRDEELQNRATLQ